MRDSFLPEDFPVTAFQDDLLDWFEKNLRDLPWRKDKDPYKIWVSEIMLQQTRVDTVIPYFERFMERFPTIEALADAPQDDVLKEWEGLGYYSRARNLHQAVQEVKQAYGGKVPDTPKEIAKLKGVGPYTAGAILSIAYDKPEPAVDGNVMRVLSRILLVEEDIQKVKTRKRFEQAVRGMIAEQHASFFNQALMELGALVCVPKSPQCMLCPVADHCRGREAGGHEELPVKGKAKPPRKVDMVAGVVMRPVGGDGDGEEEILIHKRPETGLLAGLWEFPNVEKEADQSWEESLSRYMYQYYGVKVEPVAHWMTVQHTFSHLHWNLQVYRCRLEGEEGEQLPASARWTRVEDLGDFAFSVSHGKVVKALGE